MPLVVWLHLLLLCPTATACLALAMKRLLRRHVLDAFVPTEAQDASRWRQWTDERRCFLQGLEGKAIAYSTRLFSCSFHHAHCNAFYSTQLLLPDPGAAIRRWPASFRSAQGSSCMKLITNGGLRTSNNTEYMRTLEAATYMSHLMSECASSLGWCTRSVCITTTVGSVTDALALRWWEMLHHVPYAVNNWCNPELVFDESTSPEVLWN
jgi:hypothetical protein